MRRPCGRCPSSHLARDHLPRHRQFHRGADHRGLCQQPHHAGAHRAGGKDDGVLRPLFAVGHLDDVSRDRLRRLAHRAFAEPADRASGRDAVPRDRAFADVFRQGAGAAAMRDDETRISASAVGNADRGMRRASRAMAHDHALSADGGGRATGAGNGAGRCSKRRAIPTSCSRSTSSRRSSRP